MEETIQTINNIITVVNFWLPGYVFIIIFKKLASLNTCNSAHMHVFAVVISLVIRWVLHIFSPTRFEILSTQSYYTCAIYCITGILMALLCAWFYRRKFINHLFSSLFSKSLYDSIWENIIDLDYGTALYIKLNNGNFVFGTLNTIEEKGNDSWLALDHYRMVDGLLKDICCYRGRNGEPLLMIRVADISYCEAKSCKQSDTKSSSGC